MRSLIISDIHGNYDALLKVEESAKIKGYDSVWCLGDIVGYGAQPNECCEWVRNNADTVLLGNHDAACLNEKETEYFNEYARSAVLWTMETLTPENIEFLKGLPYTAKIDVFLLVHSSPSSPWDWIYIISLYDAIMEFKHFNEWTCFFGHSHIPVIFYQKGERYNVIEPLFEKSSFELKLSQDSRYFINPGSVGQPRDFDHRASYIIFDTEENTVVYERITYDVEEARRKIYDAQLPRILGDRLLEGR